MGSHSHGRAVERPRQRWRLVATGAGAGQTGGPGDTNEAWGLAESRSLNVPTVGPRPGQEAESWNLSLLAARLHTHRPSARLRPC